VSSKAIIAILSKTRPIARMVLLPGPSFRTDLRCKNGVVCEASATKASYLICVARPVIEGGST